MVYKNFSSSLVKAMAEHDEEIVCKKPGKADEPKAEVEEESTVGPKMIDEQIK